MEAKIIKFVKKTSSINDKLFEKKDFDQDNKHIKTIIATGRKTNVVILIC